MARLVGVDLPRDKRIEVGLTYIYGIGLTTSKKILAETGVNPDTRVNDLTEDELSKLRDYIQANLTTEGDLHREAPHGNRLLPWPASSSWPARSRSAHSHERSYAQRSQASNRWQEEVEV